MASRSVVAISQQVFANGPEGVKVHQGPECVKGGRSSFTTGVKVRRSKYIGLGVHVVQEHAPQTL